MRATRAAAVSVASNLALTLGKLVAGVLTGSLGILSEAAHSAVDLAASGVAFLALRAAAQPADEDHAYGHGKYENLSGLVEGGLVLIVGLAVAWEAFKRVLVPAQAPRVDLGLAAMAISCLVNWFLSRYLDRIARAEDSPALEADAKHLSADVITGIGVLIGLLLVRITKLALFDGLTAMAVSLWILAIGIRLVASALDTLLDRSLPSAEVDEVLRILASLDDRILEWHNLRTRKAGSQRYLDVHLTVAGTLSARAAHEVAEGVEQALLDRFPGAMVMTHVDVADTGSDGKMVISD